MKVLVCPADEGGCGFYRMEEPFRVVRDMGYDVTLDLRASSIKCHVGPEGQVLYIEPIPYDVVVFQRPMGRRSFEVIRTLRHNGVKVVVELDDDFWSIEKTSVAWKTAQPQFSPESNWQHLSASLREADLVTVSTPALARVVKEQGATRVQVLRNMVPERYLEVQPDIGTQDLIHSRLSVLWTGVPGTHVGDLSVCGSGVRDAVRQTSSVFVGLGDETTAEELGFSDGEALFSPWVKLENYPSAVKSHDVGVVPLKLSPFNQSKSYLKGLEYAALGLPFIASPTEEYLRLSKSAGLIAAQKHDWQRHLKRLLTSESLRDEERLRGLEFARTNTYENHAQEWWGAWTSA